ncbi:uncharacterized protein CLUP02_12627 [Colletotrichum lupini]|uniref:Uncharacterized protein n=1 Tax=Colletotrichum lupini TaxID=145971 RepID=A0A9Q8WLK3_9PEZI|nr:uncharacterized protein CLUP02_12627 [Colletotrichum lupini]UQC87125.1 hypothetical protein CLUP02_12627 [Colletotrichum lupini]
MKWLMRRYLVMICFSSDSVKIVPRRGTRGRMECYGSSPTASHTSSIKTYASPQENIADGSYHATIQVKRYIPRIVVSLQYIANNAAGFIVWSPSIWTISFTNEPRSGRLVRKSCPPSKVTERHGSLRQTVAAARSTVLSSLTWREIDNHSPFVIANHLLGPVFPDTTPRRALTKQYMRLITSERCHPITYHNLSPLNRARVNGMKPRRPSRVRFPASDSDPPLSKNPILSISNIELVLDTTDGLEIMRRPPRNPAVKGVDMCLTLNTIA